MTTDARTLRTILVCGGLILTLSVGIRVGFGFFLRPMSMEFGWPRETFSFAIALHNLLWGASQPFFGAMADRYGAGRLGAVYTKKYLLAGVYLARSVVIALFALLPLSSFTVYAFGITFGMLYLSTVPLTNGLIADIFGVRHLAMLSGLVFFSHQIGSFFGAWLGGRLFDLSGSYGVVWSMAIALGVIAALFNLPIREKPLVQPATAAL